MWRNGLAGFAVMMVAAQATAQRTLVLPPWLSETTCTLRSERGDLLSSAKGQSVGCPPPETVLSCDSYNVVWAHGAESGTTRVEVASQQLTEATLSDTVQVTGVVRTNDHAA